MWTTACWRGFVRTFSVVDNRLLLTALEIGHLAEGEEWETINGVSPEPIGPEPGYGRRYHDLNLPLDITCGMVVGHGFIRQLFHWNPGPYQYESALELWFVKGTLLREEDHTDVARAWRAAYGRELAEDIRRIGDLMAAGLSSDEIISQHPGEDGEETRQIKERLFFDYHFGIY
jgi:hypothetical protein